MTRRIGAAIVCGAAVLGLWMAATFTYERGLEAFLVFIGVVVAASLAFILG